MCSSVLVLVTKSTEPGERREVADPEARLELLQRRDRPLGAAQAALRDETPQPLDARVHELEPHVRTKVDEDLPFDAERP
jgi:hypothetical protein